MKKISTLRKFALSVAERIYFSQLIADFAFKICLQGEIDKVFLKIDLGLKSKNLPSIRALFLSDLHIGKCLSQKTVSKVKEEILQSDYDLIFLGGDYFFIEKSGERLKELLLILKSRYGIFSVLGNHDIGNLKELAKETLKECGVRLLINEGVFLNPPYDFIEVYGMDDVKYGEPKIEKKRGEKKILLCHSPEGLKYAEGCGIDFALFGHTHGGQIVFFKEKPILPFKDKFSRSFPNGQYEGNFPFFVSKGIGCVWLPFRFNCSSEIVIIDFL